jgi:hypothetical protein
MDFDVIASGVEVDRHTSAGYTSRLFVAGPVNDFFWAASERFVMITDSAAGVTIRCATLVEALEDAHAAVYYAKQALAASSEGLGASAFPFTELDIVIADVRASLFDGGAAAEFSGAILLDWDLENWNNDFEIQPFSYDMQMAVIVFHETAHSWFPVVVASDPVAEPWLDESLVQLMTWLCCTEFYDDFGYAGFREELNHDVTLSGLSLEPHTSRCSDVSWG